ncbi:hypothetical protein MTO96_017562 [Rhipicephalus appendiculatus]
MAALLARTWAHDMSADARRNRTPRTDAAITSGNVTSGSPNCTPAKEAIVVKVESTNDHPLGLRPLTSAAPVMRSGLLQASTFERAAVSKLNRVAHQRQSQDRFAGATRTVTSEVLGHRSRSAASDGSAPSADGSDSNESKEAPK